MARIEIDKDQVLNPGDRVELHFKSSGMAWIKAAQIAIIDARMDGREDWRIREFETPVDEPTLIICRIDILGNETPNDPYQNEVFAAGGGAVVTCAAIAAVIITAGVVYSLTLQKTFLIAKLDFDKNFVQGRQTKHVAAVVLYIVCRLEQKPHLLIDFADVLQTSLYSLGSTYLKLIKKIKNNMNKLDLPLIDPSLFIHRF